MRKSAISKMEDRTMISIHTDISADQFYYLYWGSSFKSSCNCLFKSYLICRMICCADCRAFFVSSSVVCIANVFNVDSMFLILAKHVRTSEPTVIVNAPFDLH